MVEEYKIYELIQKYFIQKSYVTRNSVALDLLNIGEHVHPLPASAEDEKSKQIQTMKNDNKKTAGSGLHDADCCASDCESDRFYDSVKWLMQVQDYHLNEESDRHLLQSSKYHNFNAGGTPHSKEELERIEKMIEETPEYETL